MSIFMRWKQDEQIAETFLPDPLRRKNQS